MGRLPLPRERSGALPRGAKGYGAVAPSFRRRIMSKKTRDILVKTGVVILVLLFVLPILLPIFSWGQ
jgi:hypothetical protein